MEPMKLRNRCIVCLGKHTFFRSMPLMFKKMSFICWLLSPSTPNKINQIPGDKPMTAVRIKKMKMWVAPDT